MRAIIFSMFIVIAVAVFLNLSDGAFELNASMNERYSAQYEQLND